MPKPLTTVSDNSQMYVYFSLTENQLLDMVRRYGSKRAALDSLPAVELQLNDRTLYPLQGRVESISGVVDRTTGTASLRAVFANPDELLFSGTSGNVLLRTERKGCIVIPQAAVFEVQDQHFVYKVIDRKASASPVKVTRVNGGQEYIVEEGLTAGEVIVAEGVGMLREGTVVSD